MTRQNLNLGSTRRIQVLFFALIAMMFIAGGIWFYLKEMREIRLENTQSLTAISALKAEQLVQWRKERLGDTKRAVESIFFRRALESWLKSPNDPGMREDWRQRLKLDQDAYLYADALLVTPEGKLLLAASDDSDPLTSATLRAIATALTGRQGVISDFYRSRRGEVQLDTVAPVLDTAGRPLALLILRSNASAYLYPLIQTWPTPSRSAETLLVQREGAEVVYLNELRHRSQTALTLRNPLSQTGVPAVQAVLGRQGVFEGQDYRGEDVLADLHPIAGSPWFMVAKIDAQEILAETRERAFLIALVVLALILVVGAIISFGYRQKQATLYQEMFQSERAKHEAGEALRESEAQFRAIFETASVGMAQADPQTGNWIRVNNKMCAITGYSAVEMLAMRIPEITHPEDRQIDWEAFQRVVRGEAPHYHIEKRYLRKDGSVAWVNVNMTVLRDAAGKPYQTIATIEDITEHKRSEQEKKNLEDQLRQAQKMDSVGRLAGGVAHDFNNMLSVIMGYSEMALERLQPSDPLYPDLQEIMSAGLRSADLTRQLLAFARKQAIQPRVLDLNDTIASMLKMLGRLIGENIDLRWKPAANLWPVLMDPAQLDQILANLTVNARDAIGGVGKITIETGKSTLSEEYCHRHLGAVPGSYVMMAVSDDGCGMDQATQSQIFEPFFTTKPQGQGTGLGLATVYGIVKQNNGFIRVYSEPDHGTTFKIYLPRHEMAVSEAGATTEIPPALRGTETILLVEDELSLLELSRKLLENLGYTVLAAAGPTQALERVAEYPGKIHLLLTDVVMPEVSGHELQERLSATLPKMKCLFMSGYTAEFIAHRGVLDHGVHFLPKPFSNQSLAAKLREVLD